MDESKWRGGRGVGHRGRPARRLVAVLPLVVLVVAWLVALDTPAQAVATLPPGFQEQVVFSGLSNPTAVRFAADGRVFVAEKSGRIRVFDNLSDTTPTTFTDLSTNVYNFWDRGLLGMALDPNFSTNPYVYVLYTYDAAIGGTAPLWGSVGNPADGCPSPPGPTDSGCVVSGRLSRLRAAGNVMTGSEQVLINDWCQQFPSHSVGSLVFGPDGALYASAGDGASFNYVDYGQTGNPCGDPPVPVGGTQAPPTAQGGALRSQSLRRTGTEPIRAETPISLDGTVLRLDPATGLGKSDNPLASSANVNARRIVAYGLRNPFRITTRPGTNEIWVGDVGWDQWEEINVINTPTGPVKNFGWPCYEGNASGSLRQPGYDGANLNMCETLYAQAGAVADPFYAYRHSDKVVLNETCPTGSSSITGLAFVFGASGGPYPSEYDGALFFADHSRNCIWAMFKDPASGNVNKSNIKTFVAGAAHPVDLVIGPGGDLFYVDLEGGTIRRIQYVSGNRTPTAVIAANPTSGPAPLTVQFDGTGSSDPDGDTLTYAWDVDGNGTYTDAAVAKPTYTYSQAGTYKVGLKVTDSRGASSTPATATITVGSTPSGNTPPTATIVSPAASRTWKVGDEISFSGSATDQQDGTLPASALSWALIQQHCPSPSDCHPHEVQTFTGTSGGSFTAPDHGYPSYLELRLTATDTGGLKDTKSVRLDPQTVVLTFQTNPGSGFALTVNSTSEKAPLSRTVIVGSANTVSANTPQAVRGQTYQFDSWSDGGAQTRTIKAPATATTYTAKFRKR